MSVTTWVGMEGTPFEASFFFFFWGETFTPASVPSSFFLSVFFGVECSHSFSKIPYFYMLCWLSHEKKCSLLCMKQKIQWTSRTLKTMIPESCPAANKLCFSCAAKFQNRTRFIKTCTAVFVETSQTRILASSDTESIVFSLGWKIHPVTLCPWPFREPSSAATLASNLQNFNSNPSAALTIKGRVGWKEAKLIPYSCPIIKYLTKTSFPLRKDRPIALKSRSRNFSSLVFNFSIFQT